MGLPQGLQTASAPTLLVLLGVGSPPAKHSIGQVWVGKECQLPPSPDNNDQLKGSLSDSVSHWLLLLSAGPQAPDLLGVPEQWE